MEKIHKPKFGFGKDKAEVDVKVSPGEVGADVTVEHPSPPNVEGEVKFEGPQVDIDADKPEGKKDSKFKINLPKFGFGKEKADVSPPESPSAKVGAEVSVEQPPPPHLEGEVNVEGPKVDIDVDKPDAVSYTHLTLPTILRV